MSNIHSHQLHFPNPSPKNTFTCFDNIFYCYNFIVRKKKCFLGSLHINKSSSNCEKFLNRSPIKNTKKYRTSSKKSWYENIRLIPYWKIPVYRDFAKVPYRTVPYRTVPYRTGIKLFIPLGPGHKSLRVPNFVFFSLKMWRSQVSEWQGYPLRAAKNIGPVLKDDIALQAREVIWNKRRGSQKRGGDWWWAKPGIWGKKGISRRRKRGHFELHLCSGYVSIRDFGRMRPEVKMKSWPTFISHLSGIFTLPGEWKLRFPRIKRPRPKIQLRGGVRLRCSLSAEEALYWKWHLRAETGTFFRNSCLLCAYYNMKS